MKYHIWTTGCQMNEADSQRVASELEKLGYRATREADSADVIVLNTCVVRQSAEDKAYGRLMSLKPLKEERPDLVLGLMGCLVGVRDASPLQKRFPFVDVFLPPSDPAKLVQLLRKREQNVMLSEAKHLAAPTLRPFAEFTLSEANVLRVTDGTDFDMLQRETESRYELMDADLVLPAHERGALVSAHVPIVYGCNHVCTFCIIPYRRGAEHSRSVGEITAEVRALVNQGVKEVTLLGQIVDRYGYDVPDGPRLPDLLRAVHGVDGLERIRFLTSHPLYMTDELLDTVAALPKVCEHIEVPVQSGDDAMLTKMKRGYTVDAYRALVERIRARVPNGDVRSPARTRTRRRARRDVQPAPEHRRRPLGRRRAGGREGTPPQGDRRFAGRDPHPHQREIPGSDCRGPSRGEKQKPLERPHEQQQARLFRGRRARLEGPARERQDRLDRPVVHDRQESILNCSHRACYSLVTRGMTLFVNKGQALRLPLQLPYLPVPQLSRRRDSAVGPTVSSEIRGRS